MSHTPPITRLFVRSGHRSQILSDEAGFIRPGEDTLKVQDLLATPIVLIRRRPWIGKSFLAEQILQQRGKLGLGARVSFITFGEHCAGDKIAPGLECSQDGRCKGYWIVDAIDEAEEIEPNACARLVKTLRDIDASSFETFRVLIFCRESDVPPVLDRFLK